MSGTSDAAGADFESEYGQRHSAYAEFVSRLEGLLRDLLRDAGLEAVQVEGRAKTVESFAQKVGRKAGAYLDPLDEVTDLAGLRIITYYLEDAEQVAGILSSEFDIDADNSVDKTDELGPREFGYSGAHYVVRLNKARQVLPEWKPFYKMCAEIQVRTATQHAWAAVEHRLSYKSPLTVPQELQRRFYRLSALFELADEQFSDLRREHSKLAGQYEKSVEGGDLDIPLNATSLEAYLTDTSLVDELADHARLLGWEVGNPADHPELAHAERYDLLRVFEMIGADTLQSVDAILSQTYENRQILSDLYDQGLGMRPHMPDEIAAIVTLVRGKATADQITTLYPPVMAELLGEAIDAGY